MKTTRTSRLLLAIPAAALAFTLAACSGGAGGRPTASEVAEALKTQAGASSLLGSDIPDSALDCIAEAFVKSDKISDEDLRAMIDGKQPDMTEEESTALGLSLAPDLVTCMAG